MSKLYLSPLSHTHDGLDHRHVILNFVNNSGYSPMLLPDGESEITLDKPIDLSKYRYAKITLIVIRGLHIQVGSATNGLYFYTSGGYLTRLTYPCPSELNATEPKSSTEISWHVAANNGVHEYAIETEAIGYSSGTKTSNQAEFYSNGPYTQTPGFSQYLKTNNVITKIMFGLASEYDKVTEVIAEIDLYE